MARSHLVRRRRPLSLITLFAAPILAVGAACLVWFVASAFVEAAQRQTAAAKDEGPVVYRGAGFIPSPVRSSNAAC